MVSPKPSMPSAPRIEPPAPVSAPASQAGADASTQMHTAGEVAPSAVEPGPGLLVPEEPEWDIRMLADLTSLPVGKFGPGDWPLTGQGVSIGEWAIRVGDGTGGGSEHPQSPKHFVTLLEGPFRRGEWQGYHSMDMGKKRPELSAALSTFLGWEGLDDWKKPERLMPLDHPMVQSWILGLGYHYQGGGEYNETMRKFVEEVYGRPGLTYLDEASAATAFNLRQATLPKKEKIEVRNSYGLLAAISGAPKDLVEALHHLQMFDNSIRSGIVGMGFNKASIANAHKVLAEVSQHHNLPSGFLHANESGTTIWANGESFPMSLTRSGLRPLFVEDGVRAALIEVAKLHLQRRGCKVPEHF